MKAGTPLTVPFREKDAAKALGARWDGTQRVWYVPDGVDLQPFAQWLPAGSLVPAGATSTGTSLEQMDATGTDLVAQKGVTLSRLLAGVAAAVASAYATGVWVRAEVVRVDAKGGNVYLELSERTEAGELAATARGFIPMRVANRILPDFAQATGVVLAPGIKVLVRARPVFAVRWGLSLEIDAIDASYTTGDLAAKLREIRRRLKEEGIYGANKALRAPEDFNRILVVAPEDAAGLGDFRADADLLCRHGVCDFVYVHSRFQGDAAPAQVLAAAAEGLASLTEAGRAPDVLVVIRGGGAVNDLAWLNDYELARWICRCPVPVFSGIGHERDNTIVDEVAHTRFDTPSKVIAGIRGVIVGRVMAARDAYRDVIELATRAAGNAQQRADRAFDGIAADARSTLARARLDTERLAANLKSDARRQVHAARRDVPALMADVRSGAAAALAEARSETRDALTVTQERARAGASRARDLVSTYRDQVEQDARRQIAAARETMQAWLREVVGQGPERTMQRGFAVVYADGRPIQRAGNLRESQPGAPLEIQYVDGRVTATFDKIDIYPPQHGDKDQ